MIGTFRGATSFNGDISAWDTSNVTDMTGMFALTGVNPDTNIRYPGFNQDIGDWNTSSVTSMNHMFFQAFDFNQDLTGWNVEIVTSCFSFFSSSVLLTENLPSLTCSTDFNYNAR